MNKSHFLIKHLFASLVIINLTLCVVSAEVEDIKLSGSFYTWKGKLMIDITNKSKNSIFIKDFDASLATATIKVIPVSKTPMYGSLIDFNPFDRGRFWISLLEYDDEFPTPKSSVSLSYTCKDNRYLDFLNNTSPDTTLNISCLVAVWKDSLVHEFKTVEVKLVNAPKSIR